MIDTHDLKSRDHKFIFCKFNIDTAYVEVKYVDGSMISINCTKVENEITRNMYESSELDLASA